MTSLDCFITMIMLLPATSTMLTKLIISKENFLNTFFIFFLLFNLFFILFSIISLFLNDIKIPFDLVLVTLASVISFFLITNLSDKERNKTGLQLNINLSRSFKCIILFIVLFSIMVRLETICDFWVTNNLAQLKVPIGQWSKLPLIFMNFIFSYIIFFGEEYGWRYYLLPLLTQKYGIHIGIFFLGIIEICFHIPIDYLYNHLPVHMIIPRSMIIISSTFFISWVYLYTNNIWTVTFIHYLNNHLGELWVLTDKNLQFLHPLSSLFYILAFSPIIFFKTLKKQDRDHFK